MKILITAALIAMSLAACDSPDARSDPEADATGLVPLRAMGNEPFWNVAISKERGLVYARMGEVTISFSYAAPQIAAGDPGSYSFGPIQDASGAHTIEVSIVDEPCPDTMADRIHPMTATVTIDGEELHGCARPEVGAARE